jgi:hypothetical protein
MPGDLTGDLSTHESSLPLHRMAEKPTVLVVNEQFATFIVEHKLRDAVLSPITLE